MQAKWTDQILDETFRNLKENRPDTEPHKLDRTRELMAGAVRAKAQVIVTFNLRDFPAGKLSVWDVQAVHPDAFIEAQVDLSPQLVFVVLTQIADARKSPPNAVVADVIASLEREGLVGSAAALRALA
ncbi:hypothetical protein [Streptomyces daliensis]|uniref:VapC50 C-terminal domain-containing protein n=1 Tax=Streptomyces daliensis TaxID=299421 RepID=A0A8T4IW24_9ACTN|nr:hypothetical protein [Streptomyces daliensis]